MKRKFTFFLSCLMLFALSSFAQKVITGKVTDANDGTGIPGVSVYVKGTSQGVSTKPDGSYSITVSVQQ